MSPIYIQGLVVVLCASLLGVTVADTASNHVSGCRKPTPKKINVGGSNHWRFGFNYSDWAFSRGPFYVKDSLVFKYELPGPNNPHPHSVYVLPDLESFVNCNLTKGVKLADESHGIGKGFEFVLKKRQPYYFACGASNGYHCNFGGMKFFVLPYLRH